MQENPTHTLNDIRELPDHAIRLSDVYRHFGRRMYDAIRKAPAGKVTTYYVKQSEDAQRGQWYVVAEGCAEDFNIHGPLVKRAIQALYDREDLKGLKQDIADYERRFDEARAAVALALATPPAAPTVSDQIQAALPDSDMPATRAQADRLESLLSQVLDHLTRPAAGGLTHLAQAA